MAFPGKRTRIKRKAKKKKSGIPSKRARDNQGSTIRVPLEGPLSSSRYGMAIKADKIVIN